MEEKTNPLNGGKIEGADRDKKTGKFIKGRKKTGGKKLGSISITSAIKKKLSKLVKGKDKTYLEYLILQILNKATVEGDTNMIKAIWSYIDGMPKQSMTLENPEQTKALQKIAESIKKLAETKE